METIRPLLRNFLIVLLCAAVPLSSSASVAKQELECHAELLGCMRGCVGAIPKGLSIDDHSILKRRCNDMCMAAYTACIKAVQPLTMLATVTATVDWLNKNADVILVGTVLILGTAALIFISDGAAIALVPYTNYLMQQYMLSR